MKRWFTVVIALVIALNSFSLAQSTGSTPDTSRQEKTKRLGPRRQEGVVGTVTQVATDHYTITTVNGDYTVWINSATRFSKQSAERSFDQSALKSTDIKVGDTISSFGDTTTDSSSVIAQVVILNDPTLMKKKMDLKASYGKTWVAGNITVINGSTLSLIGAPDGHPFSVLTNQNTAFSSGGKPIELTDLGVGDAVHIRGSGNGDSFTATTVQRAGRPMNPGVPRHVSPSSVSSPQ
ncbi:MAG: hypothetical protein FWD64_00360 [Acidobacteriaceae bacterium]|nr:hypothetical protein [Acidobacteriaceae bacterium]